ncbi:glucokinase [Pseudooceanicola sp.]|uniref:glucokinase n=1 Tax=Pseudooceanicola sp. TaxID=1914328 RepID=UPI0026240C3D|nr:glucokinase [Pseudooceanicola sp.]MDF1854968.1 glucokinase [Pseudooceanicola sp.]
MDLLGDIGGSHSRFALAQNGTIVADSLRRLNNDDFPRFDAALAAYLAEVSAPPLSRIALAVAGPMTGRRITMTNRDWSVDGTALAADGARVVLMNDLTALGLAVPVLGQGSLETISAGIAEGPGQALVLNLGTGVNIAAIRLTETGAIRFESEYGHAALSAPIAEEARRVFGEKPRFPTVESLFGGVALNSLGVVLDRPEAAEIGAMLGLLVRDLAVTLLPRAGLYLSGGVARALMAGPGRDGFTGVLGRPFEAATGIQHLPVWLITDDLAALRGCLAALGSAAV